MSDRDNCGFVCRESALMAARKHIYAFLLIILILSATACSSQTKEFQTSINSLVEHYNAAINTEDMLTEDLNLKVAAGDLWVLSQIYQKADNRDELNNYLDKNISKDMFEKVYKYNKTRTMYTLEDDIVAYYNDK